ncbi:hypothetical protein HMPREF3039_00254 [Akkermansia sp. KLE1798]|nr:hypothetical protein HMPREF3039_00254 [Akkermansia sp. KLE1798]KZA03365.1 hypothetical protein HMPREF1326_02980 [Akkermansia sp. KLE1605]
MRQKIPLSVHFASKVTFYRSGVRASPEEESAGKAPERGREFSGGVRKREAPPRLPPGIGPGKARKP